MPESTGPLAGVRVVDLSKILAGPYVTMSLADMGADVIKVEHPDGGDPTRKWGPPFNGPDATYYLAANRNKRSVTLDLKSPEGQAAVHRLIEDADVVVENFRPGSSLADDFSFERLSEQYPKLVVLNISAFGETGPMKLEPGYDMVAQASAGLMSLTGEPDGPPLKAGFAMADLSAALFGTIGLLAALVERGRTGRGQYVTTSLFETQLALHINWSTGYFATRERPKRLGSGHPNLVPYQAYPASDGYFVIAVGNESMWQKLCHNIDRPDLLEDPRFASNADRVTNRKALNVEIEAALAGRTVDEWCDLLGKVGVPVTPIRSLDEIYESEQTKVLGMIDTVDHPVVGPLEQIRFPVNFRGERPVLRSAPPTLGQHSRDILSEIGYDDAEIDKLIGGAS
ncbi:CaiB/BaiF CoA transferase family protein [Nocardioides sp. Root151]|uniref:CaiB/BaiF CoA transferase family protein n=1 Tax=Nocardioides sp. Root151 TaxID=1736475 RepID=UPI00070263DF|nr:CoA transferase [Nocardioides sp. Root151]KQZ70671.1 formyl-CoA transferase [Nocardioides sp. Root151]